MDMAGTGRNFLEELMVVLVLYKMEIHESPAVISLTTALKSLQQRTSIFIYDNSPNAHAHTHTPGEQWHVTYHHNAANPGVGKAYNEGFRLAGAQNKKWLLLVDQDSVFEKDFFSKCKTAIGNDANEEIFVPRMVDSRGIVSPFYFRLGRGFRLNAINEGQYRLSGKRFINSGILITCRLFEVSGGYDEQFSLDFSDLVFLERLETREQTFRVLDSTCEHALSASAPGPVTATLDRFKSYCRAADQFRRQTGNPWVVFWKYARAIIFFCKYFDARFITLAFSS